MANLQPYVQYLYTSFYTDVPNDLECHNNYASIFSALHITHIIPINYIAGNKTFKTFCGFLGHTSGSRKVLACCNS